MNTNKLYRDLVHQITTPSLPQKLEIAFSVILLLSIPVFWLWLLAQPHYSVGVVSLVESFSDDESVAQLTLLGKEDFIIGQTKLLVAHIESWVFTLGERITLPENEFINPPLLDTEEMATLPLLGYLLTHPVSNWLEALGTSHGWAMVVSALLLIMAGFAFRMTYVILMCGASLATLWHVLTIGSWMGFFELGDVGLYLLLGVSALVILRWTRTHRHFSIAEPAIAVFMWWLFGETILIRLGLDSQWLYGLTFFLALLLPGMVSALIAAYLLSVAFSATLVGTYCITAFCVLVSASQIGVNTFSQNLGNRLISRLKRVLEQDNKANTQPR
ncbi:hypothetical protein P7M41_12260 [Vibrio parahaemolyticus]|uniref:hypothetical protein n=1 Tax=Vibrio parahaemolyticus TaxID=670 RepID=UPI0004DF9FEF|nr:hypothetical protein [Vibrio parahaemolyticus]HAS6129856.1 hypothetical protein [Vibrio vulnificus]MDF4257147.1 hypothetical protein [Vibrio parahaemolyticus]MDF4262371.1 hypothetical protein [Vibrio parahaemolyticus]MDF4324227.1 hypothetical protein [Vibrio parahaemolyticus]MDG2552807.1 hypothetical protein [Vibrio parahaemolyticus]